MTDKKVTEYEKYLRVPELLALQKTPEEMSCHDELLFQVVHQIEELWMKLALHEMAEAGRSMRDGEIARATYALRRVHIVEWLMAEQLRLVETLSPRAYFTIRQGLGRGSGSESPGFNAILAAAPALWAAFTGVLERRGKTVLEIHEQPDRAPELFQLAEGMLDFDEYFQRFRTDHLALVRRIIGGKTPSLKGMPAELLAQSATTELFPELWSVREAIFKKFVPGTSE